LAEFQFSTDAYQGRDKVAAWREIFGQKIAQLDMEPIGDRPFRGEARVRSLPNLTIGSISSTPNRITRTRALVADGSDDVMLGIMLEGQAAVYQEGHGELTVGRGDAVVWSNSTPGYSHYPEPIDFLAVAIPRAVLVPHLLHPDSARLSVIPGAHPALRLLTNYVQAMRRSDMPPKLQAVAAMHVHDLVASALGPTPDAAHMAANRGGAHARLQAIKADILANMAHADLTIGAVAERHGISSRSIRKLFSSAQTTFTDFVLEQRLARVHRALCDPRFAGRTISSIAFENGFGDISYFNTVFRRRYGSTPTAVREAAGPSP
jgi:AraC-like DNA-binding protein